jgi:hypothetical protein
MCRRGADFLAELSVVSDAAEDSPMRSQDTRWRRLALGLVSIATAVAATTPSSPSDPLAAEVARWSEYVRTNSSTDPMWLQVKDGMARAIAQAEGDLRAGRRLLALERLADVEPDLEASMYLGGLSPAERGTDEAFEAAWMAAGKDLARDLGPPSPAALVGVQPAAVRAIGETAIPAVRAYYEASSEYGRNTMAEAGLFYLGVARGQLGLAALCRKISVSSARRPPPLRSIRGEIDDLEGELLAAYRPPASIDRHKDFIAASATLKEARELDAAGLRYGTVLRYLQAALRTARLTGNAPALTSSQAARRIGEIRKRLGTDDAATDHSLALLFLEMGESEIAGAAEGASPEEASAIVGDVMPRYFAALGPARPRPPQPAPSVTVTLVRWPYT